MVSFGDSIIVGRRRRSNARFPLEGGVTYLLRDEFTTDASAPLASPRTCEPGPGTLTILDTNNVMSIASGALTKTGSQFNAWTDPLVKATITRVAGRAFLSAVNTASQMMMALLLDSAGGNNKVEHGLYWSSATAINAYQNSAAAALPAVTSGTTYQLAFVLRSTGAYLFIKGGTQFTNWTLIWVFVGGTSSPLYGSPIYNGTGTVTHDYIRVTDLPAPFSTDALAQINITSATQSLGSELLTNGNFSAWSSGDPTGWTVTGQSGSDPDVSEVAPNGSAGTGAGRFYSSATSFAPTASQTVLTTNAIYEATAVVSLLTSGNPQIIDSGGGAGLGQLTTAGTFKGLWRAKGAGFYVRGSIVLPSDFIVDSATVKQLAINAAQTINADSIIDFTFILPVSPVAGDQVHLCYRINAAGDEFNNCYDAYLLRDPTNARWDFKLDSIASGTRTNRVNTTGVGNVTTIRVITNGNTHDCYTLVSSTWTKRGSTITNAAFNTAVLCNTIYTSDFTFGSLVAWPITASAYAELDKA